MKNFPKLIALALPLIAAQSALLPSPASAAPRGANLAPVFVAPSSTLVGSVSHYEVRVVNTGTRDSGPATMYIQLPKTATSPQVLIMGQFSGLQPSQCTLSGQRIACSLPPVVRNGYVPVSFDIRHPYSAAPISFRADVDTNNEIDYSNNGANFTLAQTFFTVPSTAPAPVTVKSCTGTNLSSFFECTSFSGSIQQHQVTLAPGGLLDFSVMGPDAAGMGGTWSVNGSQLNMTYTESGQVVGTFVGQGASANCWEGRMTFGPGPVAIYQVCR